MSKTTTEEERQKLVEKLDEDLDNFINNLEKKPYTDGFSRENWEKEMQQHPAFMTKMPEDGSLPPLVEALQQLKYDPNENSPEELAKNYKEDGNNNFKLKKYRWAIDAYTEGIKIKCKNSELNAQLHCNRAAAHYHLGNFRSAFLDCEIARKLKPDYMKAIIRGVDCCLKIGYFTVAITWCNEGLQLNPQEKSLKEFKKKAEEMKKISERDKRKNAMKSNKEKNSTSEVLKAIKERKIHIDSLVSVDSDEEIENPFDRNEALSSKVHLDENGCIVWPVLFMYPQYEETDFIEAFHENSCFEDHLKVMFDNATDHPGWDVEGSYTSQNLEIYAEDKEKQALIKIPKEDTLLDVIKDSRCPVYGGMPAFIVLPKQSPFTVNFLSKYL